MTQHAYDVGCKEPGRHGGIHPPWTEGDLAYLRENYATVRPAKIAQHLGRTYNAVVLRARKEKLGSFQRAGCNSLVPDFFRLIDTPLKAYLLGLLMADGSISTANQLKLEVHQKDRLLAEVAREAIAPDARIAPYHTRTTPMVRFLVQSADLATDLARHGVVNAKSLTVTWPKTVPPKLINSYICGCYDGDGSLDRRGYYRWSVVSGVPEFLSDMKACIADHAGVWVGGPYRDKRHEHAWSIVITGQRPVLTLDAWIHRDVSGLPRKRF